MISSASEFMQLAVTRKGTVEVRGQTVHIREMTLADRKRFMEAVEADRTAGPSVLVQLCAMKPDGSTLFSEDEAAELGKAAPEVVDTVAAAILRLSGVEDGEKND